MIRTRCLAVSLLFVAAAALAQTPATTPSAAQPLPADPATLLQLAAPVNGLYGLQAPLHLHLTFQVLDHDRNIVDRGTVELWQSGERQYRISVKSSRFSSDVYLTDGRTVTVGDQNPPAYPLNLIAPALQNPLPDEAWTTSMILALQHSTVGGEDMVCVAAHSPLSTDTPNTPAEDRYCFQGSSPAVRLSELSGSVYAYDSVSEFDGRWVARSLRITSPGKFASEVDARIDTLEVLDPVPAGIFNPPLHAGISRIPIESGVMAGKRISGTTPKYPSSAKKKRIQGTVVLLATIDKEGKITNLEVISGLPELQEPSVKAVRDWRYTPYTLNGQPVEVETQINVNFALGH
jgi:TonB family protein